MEFDKAVEALHDQEIKKRSPKYEKYFNMLRPKTVEDKFRRGLFALSSVHTSWKLNCELYTQLWDMSWLHDMNILRERIIDSGAGLVNVRTKAFSQYAAFFWQFPNWLEKRVSESWFAYTDRVEKQFYGLGPAKSAFLAELLYFHDNRAVCVDTHMLQLYGFAPKDVGNVKPVELARIETHWDCTCNSLGVNPVTARWITWDIKVSQQQDSSYWAYVLEPDFKPVITIKPIQTCLPLQ